MNIVALLFGIGVCGGAVIVFRRAKEALVFKRQATGLRMTPIVNLKPGLALTGGEVVCDAPLKTPYTQTVAVWHKYAASERRRRRKQSGFYEQSLTSGEQACPFYLKDHTGEVKISGQGGEVIGYPHYRVLKSQSGKKTGLGNRIQKLKEIDREQYPEGTKKPFFRKIESVDKPLDIPDDLIELEPESSEEKQAVRKYYEHWIQPGDHIFVMGTAVRDENGPIVKIVKTAKRTPFLAARDAKNLTAQSFTTHMIVLVLVGAGLALLGLFLTLIGFGIIGS